MRISERRLAIGGPDHVLHYLARYTHRVAISNHRLLNITDDAVTFRWKDYRHGSQPRTITVGTDEFLRRFLLHVLPRALSGFASLGFWRIDAAPMIYRSVVASSRLIRPRRSRHRLAARDACGIMAMPPLWRDDGADRTADGGSDPLARRR